MMFSRMVLAFSLFGHVAKASEVPKAKYRQLDSILNKFVADVEAASPASDGGIRRRRLTTFEVPQGMLMNASGDAIVEVRGKGLDNEGLRQLLEQDMGFKVTGCFRNTDGSCSAIINMNDLPNLLTHAEIVSVTSNFVGTNAGLVTSEAFEAMMADDAARLFGVDGTGVKVCVMSDSFNCNSRLNTNANDDVLSGDLPPFERMEIVRDLEPTDIYYGRCIDEGRAMMQLIHDIAPGADLGFYTAAIGLSAFADGIMDLVHLGCHIIVDDITYFAEAWYQDDKVAQAVDYANDMGVPYFSSAGNSGRFSWEGEWQESPFRRRLLTSSTCGCETCTEAVLDAFAGEYTCGGRISWKQEADNLEEQEACRFVGEEYPLECGACNPDVCADSVGGASTGDLSTLGYLQFPGTSGTTVSFLRVFVQRANTIVIMQWDDPKVIQDGLPGPQTDLDIYVYDAMTDRMVALSNAANEEHGFEILMIENPGTYEIEVERYSGPEPNLVKITFQGPVVRDPMNGPRDSISAGTVTGHQNARGAIGVAAAFFENTPGFGVSPAEPEGFTSAGGVPILFDTQGNRLNRADIRQSPAITAPDGTCTTFFGNPDPGDSRCRRFFGTSAAAPNAAAVAALMLEVQPRLQPEDIRAILQRTAEDMDSPHTPWFDHGYDFLTGYGFVNALFAVGEAALPLSKVKLGKGGKGKKSEKDGGKSGKGKSNVRHLTETYEDAKHRRRLKRDEREEQNRYHDRVNLPSHSIDRRHRIEEVEETNKQPPKSFQTIRGA